MSQLIFDASDFNWIRQLKFSILSGDYNPIHIDRESARKVLIGMPIVHGMNLVLSLVNKITPPPGQPRTISRISGEFLKPIPVGGEIVAEIKVYGNGLKAFISDSSSSKPIRAAIFDIEYQSTDEPRRTESKPERKQDRARIPCEVDGHLDETHQRGSLSLGLDVALLCRLFPMVLDRINLEQVGSLLALSRLVGMRCPGQNSLFASFDVSFHRSKKLCDRIYYKLARYRKPLKLVEVGFESMGCSGTLSAFVMPPVVEKRSVKEIQSSVAHAKFASQRAVVIGGCRGIGESVSKCLLVGGAEKVVATYNAGIKDAIQLKEWYQENNSKLEIIHCDVLSNRPWRGQTGAQSNRISSLYYFPTPRIVPQSPEGFSQELFTAYVEYFVIKFARMVRAVKEVEPDLSAVFLPSTEFILKKDPKHKEYTLSKKLAEEVAYDLASDLSLNVFAPRLPVVLSDQTNTLMKNNKVVDVLTVLPRLLNRFEEIRTNAGATRPRVWRL